MITTIARWFGDWKRRREFQSLAYELELVHSTRAECDRQERRIRRRHAALVLKDVNANVASRRAVR